MSSIFFKNTRHLCDGCSYDCDGHAKWRLGYLQGKICDLESLFVECKSCLWVNMVPKGIYTEKLVIQNHFYGRKVDTNKPKICIDTPTQCFALFSRRKSLKSGYKMHFFLHRYPRREKHMLQQPFPTNIVVKPSYPNKKQGPLRSLFYLYVITFPLF